MRIDDLLYFSHHYRSSDLDFDKPDAVAHAFRDRVEGFYFQPAGWPRQLTNQGGQLVYYQPHVGDWKDFKDLTFRMALYLTPKGGQEVFDVVNIHGLTDVSVDQHRVVVQNLSITGTSFPSLDPATAKTMDQLLRTFLPSTHTITMSLEHLSPKWHARNATESVQHHLLAESAVSWSASCT